MVIFDVPEIVESERFPKALLEPKHVCMQRSIWVKRGQDIIYSQIQKILIFDILIKTCVVLWRLQSTVTNFSRAPLGILFMCPPLSSSANKLRRRSTLVMTIDLVLLKRLEFNAFPSYFFVDRADCWQMEKHSLYDYWNIFPLKPFNLYCLNKPKCR